MELLDKVRKVGYPYPTALTSPDQALNHFPSTDDLFRKTLRRLQSTCSNREVLPSSYLIPNELLSKKERAAAAGGFADVYEGEFNGQKVCIKTLRLYSLDTGDVTKKVRSSVVQSLAIVAKTAGPVGILQRSCCVEDVTPSKHRSFSWSSHQNTTVRDRLRLDGRWSDYGIRRKEPAGRSHRSCG